MGRGKVMTAQLFDVLMIVWLIATVALLARAVWK